MPCLVDYWPNQKVEWMMFLFAIGDLLPKNVEYQVWSDST